MFSIKITSEEAESFYIAYIVLIDRMKVAKTEEIKTAYAAHVSKVKSIYYKINDEKIKQNEEALKRAMREEYYGEDDK